MFDLNKKLEDLSNINTSTRADFDFLLGDWNVKNKLWTPFNQTESSKEEQVFEANLSVKKIVGGDGQIDIFRSKKIEASTLRLFDPKTKLWSLYWITSTNPEVIEPQIGIFNSQKGEFYGITRGTAKEQIVVKFVWTNLTTEIPRWEQYFSFDEGKNWERNWVMDFLRTEKPLYYF
jgi:hypothetical protein